MTNRTALGTSSLRRLILVIGSVLLLVSAIEVLFLSTSHRTISHASGVYVTLATDLADGHFYPPFSGELGYRGTRYFPLYFSTHAALIELLGDPYLAGHVLGILSGLALLVGLYYFLRGVGAESYLAFAAVAALAGCRLTPILMTSIRGDILPAALTVCGLAIFVQPGERTSRRLFLTSVFFTLAFASKITAIFGITAACLVLLFDRNVKQCIGLASMTLLGYLAVLGGAQALSGGRFARNVTGIAEAGFTMEGLLGVPGKLRGVLSSFWLQPDWGTLMFLALGMVGFVVQPKEQRTHVSSMFFLVILGVTPIMFVNPGLHINHFLEPLAASLALMASMLVIGNGQSRPWGSAVVASALILTTLAALWSWTRVAPWEYERRYDVATEVLGDVDGPVLSDNANIPILLGQTPFMMDAWIFRMIREQEPGHGDELFRRIEQRRFAAIVLEKFAWLQNPRRHFGNDVYESIEEHYDLYAEANSLLFYLPRDGT